MSSTIAVQLEPIADAPPSINQVGSRGHWRSFHAKKRQWQGMLGTALIASGPELEAALRSTSGPVRATGAIYFRVKRRRDEGNFRAILEKSLGDALVGDPDAWPEGRWIPDDTPEHYRFERLDLMWVPELPFAAETRIRLELDPPKRG